MVNIKKLTNFIDKSIDNVYEVDLPYNYLWKDTNSGEKKQVIFFGGGFKNTVSLDMPEFIKRMNLCLDYIRQQCHGCDLYYKPHQNETDDERRNYNLKSFKILDTKEVAEIYFLKNLHKIDCVFAITSSAAINAYKAGINSYIFYKIFEDVFDDSNRLHYKFFLGKMPKRFFIEDLNRKLIKHNNAPKTSDDFLLNFLKKLLFYPEKQKVWITVDHPAHLLKIVSLVNLIREACNVKVVNLIMSKHRTWENIDIKYLESYFDSIYFFPRLDYSLRRRKNSLRRRKNLISLFKTRLQVKKLKISKEDLIINFSPREFIENMVVSSFKKCKKITFMLKNTYEEQINIDFLEKNQFSFTRTSHIFNRVIEPILSINRTLVLYNKQGIEPYTFIKYEKPLNKIYDYVLLY